MNQKIQAVYENGTLVLDKPLAISNGSKVEIVVVADKQEDEMSGFVAKRLAEIAAMPLEGDEEKFSGRDHDRILYRRDDNK